MKKIYLSIPYTWNPERSFQIANKVAAELMLAGNVVYSPISMGHNIADHLPEEARTSSDWWRKYEPAFIEWCDEMHIVYIRKTKSNKMCEDSGMALIAYSKGCQAEKQLAEKLGKPIKLHLYDKA